MPGLLSEMAGLDDVDLPELVARLGRGGITVACAESLTGGLLTAVLTDVPGASAVVRGALVVYATDLKASLARVDGALLAERGPVDPDVAIALAHGARTVCGATVGIGLTGVAGPDPQNGIPVGTFYVAVVAVDHVQLQARHPEDLDPRPAGHSRRSEIRVSAVRLALSMLGNVPLPD